MHFALELLLEHSRRANGSGCSLLMFCFLFLESLIQQNFGTGTMVSAQNRAGATAIVQASADAGSIKFGFTADTADSCADASTATTTRQHVFGARIKSVFCDQHFALRSPNNFLNFGFALFLLQYLAHISQ